jgi:hypothetical protein
MSDEKASEPVASHKPKQTLREILKESGVSTSAVIEHTHPVTGRPRQIVAAGLLGVCVVFVAAVLSLPRLDTPLHVALIAFVVAIVLLSLDFTYVSVKFGPGLSRFADLFTRGLQVAAWIVFEGIGMFAVFVGVATVVLHLSVPAFWIGVFTLVGGQILSLVVALLYAIVSVWHEYKAQQRQQTQTTGDAPSSEPAAVVAPAPSVSPSSAVDAE